MGLALLTLVVCLLTAQCAAASQRPSSPAAAASTSTPLRPGSPAVASSIGTEEAQTLDMLLAVVPARYESARATHDVALAEPVRTIVQDVRDRVLQSRRSLDAGGRPSAARAIRSLNELSSALESTRERYEPWPPGFELAALGTRARAALAAALHPAPTPTHPYEKLESALARVSAELRAGHDARTAALRAYALYADGPGRGLLRSDSTLDAQITERLLPGRVSAPSLSQLAQVRSDLDVAAQVLGLVKISRTTVVVNGAIIVFREGLEAVLILAAITASFVGAKRHMRRPVLLGALAGLLATALTWVVAQLLLHLLGDGGLELQAITGLVAIGVLLLVTNWFFHRVYWSEWISRFNRRRKALEGLERFGFFSGQALGLVLLGLSSVYREGLETVLFLQALQTSAGTGAAALGAGIGLAGTLIVGAVTFKLQRKLPFKRMLVLTGVLIALVLAVMVGTTVHNLQGIGWLPSTASSFAVPIDWSTWLGVYPTWEGIGAQGAALAFVFGSYFVAREIQVNRPRRRARRAQERPPPDAASGAAAQAAAAPARTAF